jgi:hypothetical protein
VDWARLRVARSRNCGGPCRVGMNRRQRTRMDRIEGIEQRASIPRTSPFGAKLNSLQLRSPMNFRRAVIPGRNNWGKLE